MYQTTNNQSTNQPAPAPAPAPAADRASDWTREYDLVVKSVEFIEVNLNDLPNIINDFGLLLMK